MEKLFKSIGRDIGIAQGMAAAACVVVGILWAEVKNVKNQLKELNKKEERKAQIRANENITQEMSKEGRFETLQKERT